MRLGIVAAVLGAIHLALSGHLIINWTASVPPGIYWLSTGTAPHRGDLVALPIPAQVRELLYGRRYLPRSIKLLAKPVAAVAGDVVCMREHELFINGVPSGNSRDQDRLGQPLPMAQLCGPLSPGELFLSTKHDNSFDSRNFGPVPADEVLGTLTPVLLF